MRILEVEQDAGADPKALLGLVNFLVGRAEDTNSSKQISQDAFIKLAHSLGIFVTKNTLGDIISQPPLSNVLEPLDPNSGMVTFKGADIGPEKMSVNQAQQTVDRMAKSAMKRGMK
mgnify:FL=1|jgi:hypothetical protein